MARVIRLETGEEPERFFDLQEVRQIVYDVNTDFTSEIIPPEYCREDTFRKPAFSDVRQVLRHEGGEDFSQEIFDEE